MFLTIEHKNVTEKLTAFLLFEPQTTCVEIKRGNEPNSNKKASQTNKHQVLYITENREISHNNILANLADEKKVQFYRGKQWQTKSTPRCRKCA